MPRRGKHAVRINSTRQADIRRLSNDVELPQFAKRSETIWCLIDETS
jgi:hypothetical protein